MDRRTFCSLVAAGVTGLAGCSESEADPDPTTAPGTTTDEQSGTTTGEHSGTTTDEHPGDAPVALLSVDHQHTLRYLTAPDAMGVVAPEGERYVFATLSVAPDADPPALDSVSLGLDGESFDPLTEVGNGFAVAKAGHDGRPYDPSDDDPDGWVLFRVPAGREPEDAHLAVGQDATLPLPDDAVAVLAEPAPSFEVRDVSVPDSVPPDREPELSISVENAGEGPGTFRAAVNHHGPMYGASPVDVPLAAGESTTHATDITVVAEAGGRMLFDVVWPGGSEEFEVHIEGEGSPTDA